jgi:hypothetical protein
MENVLILLLQFVPFLKSFHVEHTVCAEAVSRYASGFTRMTHHIQSFIETASVLTQKPWGDGERKKQWAKISCHYPFKDISLGNTGIKMPILVSEVLITLVPFHVLA